MSRKLTIALVIIAAASTAGWLEVRHTSPADLVLTGVVTTNDLARLQPLSATWLGKSQQTGLDYETILELVAEKNHSHPNLVRRLNPGVNWTNVLAGTSLHVPDISADDDPTNKAAFARISLSDKVLEAFDEEDLELAQELTQAQLTRSRTAAAPLLIGVNCRDLQTLEVRPERFATLAPFLPQGSPAVAESGVATAADARRMQDLGYRVALIGTALMSAPSPPQLLADIFAATRTVKR